MNSVRNAGRRRMAPRRVNPATQLALRRQKDEMLGHEYLPKPDPTSFVAAPWNSFTYQAKLTVERSTGGIIAPKTVEIVNIAQQISDVVTGEPTTFTPEIKVTRAAAWNIASQNNALKQPQLTAGFYELNDGSGTASIRTTVNSAGTLQEPACAGYVFSASDSREVFGTGNGTRKIMTVSAPLEYWDGGSAAETCNILVRVYVLWRAKSTLQSLVEQSESI